MNERTEYYCNNSDCGYEIKHYKPGKCPDCKTDFESITVGIINKLPTNCIHCNSNPCRLDLQNHCVDCFKIQFLKPALDLRREMFQELSRIQTKIDKYSKLLDGALQVSVKMKHKCLCNRTFDNFVDLQDHLDSMTVGHHTSMARTPQRKITSTKSTQKVFNPDFLS